MKDAPELLEKFTSSFTMTEMVPESSVFPNVAFVPLHTVSELLFHITLKAKS